MAGDRFDLQHRALRAPARLTRSQMGTEILQTLRERILNWYYPPGAHLGEQAICDEFSSSRIPVREALRSLVAQGLASQVPNSGCYVKQPDAIGLRQLYDHRLALELFIVERLAQNGLSANIGLKLRREWEVLSHARSGSAFAADSLIDADEAFHLGLARGLGNPLIVDALEAINVRLRFVRRVVLTTPERIQESANDHLRILSAVENRDTEAARRALMQHIHYALSKVEVALAEALNTARIPK